MAASFHAGRDVIATPLEGELILLDPHTGQMFSLNETGRFVWDRLGTCNTDQIVTQVAETFDVSRERAEADVRALMSGLLDAGLIQPRDD